MVQLVLKFVACARGAGMRVSTSEVLDCIDHLSMVNMCDEESFRAVLRMNFAKSRREQSKFDHVYHLFFKEMRPDARSQSEKLGEQIAEIVEFLRQQKEDDAAFEASVDMMAGDPVNFLAQMRSIQSEQEQPGPKGATNLGQLSRRLHFMLQLNQLDSAVSKYLTDNRSQIPWQNRRDLERHFKNRVEIARSMLTREPRPHNEALEMTTSYEQHLSDLGERSFASLTRKEVEEMRDVIDHLVRKLKDVVSRRYAKKNRGILDVKKTLRLGTKYQGVPIEVVYRHKPMKKGKIVTLCDVSGSVWSAARFMLNMLYSVQECFTSVRSYIFVAGLAEVTDIFDQYEINQAIDNVLKKADISYNAPTDYGATLRQFKKDHMDVLNKKTTVIIIGDGRSNYSNPEDGIFDEIRERCRRIIWLNPEPEVFWYSGDSEMRTYEAYCHQVRPCQNLNQLLDFIKELVL